MLTRTAILREAGLPPPYARSRPLSLCTAMLDPPGPGEVLVRVAAAGLCHSDLSVINGERPRPLPMALGHEAAGVVAALGDGVDDLVVGDHVVMVFMPSCGRCLPCAEGRPALCEPGAAANGAGTLLRGGRRLSCEGVPLNHHLGCSAFADLCVVARGTLVRIDRALPLDEAALFGCAVLTGVGAAVNTARITAGQTVAVIGLGGVGLAALLGAAAAGASRIVAVDIAASKLELARGLGATDVFDAGAAGVAADIRAATGGGLDAVLEMAGSPRAMQLAWAITRRGGTTVTAGLPPPDATLAVPLVALVGEERTLKGSYIGGCVPARDIPRYIALYRRGLLPVDRLLSGRLPLEGINEGFDRLRDGRALRQVVVMEAPEPPTLPRPSGVRTPTHRQSRSGCRTP